METDEIDLLVSQIDANNDGKIDYAEFVALIKEKMSTERENLVREAFRRIDKDGQGFIEYDYLKRSFIAAEHPDKVHGKKNEDEILLEFLETFEIHHTERNHENEAIVTISEFMSYYDKVSPIFQDDLTFERMMKNCWCPENEKGEIYRPANMFAEDTQTAEIDKQNIILLKFKEGLKARGPATIANLARKFKIADDNNSKTLEFDEFTKACRDFNINLNKNELRVLFGVFDTDKSGFIDYDEFLLEIRGDLSSRRRQLVEKVYKRLDVDGNNTVDLNDFKIMYNASTHPKVLSGEKTEDEVYSEFLKVFECSKTTSDGILTLDEFLEYYRNVSASIDSDDYFELLINNAWKTDPHQKKKNQKMRGQLEEDSNQGKATWLKHNFKSAYSGGSVSSNAPFGTIKDEPVKKPKVHDYSQMKTSQVLEKFRSKLRKRGSRGILGMRRNFKIADDNGDGFLSFEEFAKFNRDYRTDLSEEELFALFSEFDVNRDDRISYDEFCRGVAGEMNNFRKTLVMKAFRKADVTGNKLIEVDDLRNVYCSKGHPDVKSGKKTEDEVLAEFLDTFETHFMVLKGKKGDSSITLEEFIEYYTNISMSIDEDIYFEHMINQAWDLDNSRVKYGKAWRKEV